MEKSIYIMPQMAITELRNNQILCISQFKDNDGNVTVGISDGEGDFGDDDVINIKGNIWEDIWDGGSDDLYDEY